MLHFKTNVEVEEGIKPNVANAMQMLAHVYGLIDCLKDAGLTKEEAVQRIGVVVGHAWDNPPVAGSGAEG